jgi:mono/diheme cytochrome c family protein
VPSFLDARERGGMRKTIRTAVIVAALPAIPAGAGEDAGALYKAKCQSCHGIDGKAPFPDLVLADDKWLHGESLAEITKVIEEGVPGKPMASFKAQLTKPQIDALAKYVRALAKKGKGDSGK